ncbi:hypothetical protein [Thermus antranikianii]|nr:hypothetical protein [Thermus antranikianii]
MRRSSNADAKPVEGILDAAPLQAQAGGRVSSEELLAQMEALKQENPKDPGFHKRVIALVQEAYDRWNSLPQEQKQAILASLTTLLSLLPAGRLGRVGLLLKKALGPEGQLALAALLRLLKR